MTTATPTPTTPALPVAVTPITDWSQVPGSDTYFRTSDVTPFYRDGSLHTYQASGPRRSWGQSTVRSTVTRLTDEVVRVHVVGWHKHTVGPVGGFFYFVREGEGWTRRTAAHKRVKAAIATHAAAHAQAAA